MKHKILHEDQPHMEITFTKEYLNEDEGNLFKGFFSHVAMLSSALIFLIMASILLFVGATAIAYVLIGLASSCVVVWMIVHRVPVIIFKWVTSFVEI